MADEWSPEHSVAALLVGMSMIDGEVASDEMKALIEVLHGFPGIRSSEAAHVGQAAYRHMWQIQEDGAGVVDTLRRLAAEVGLHYEPAILESIHERLHDMAMADGQVHPMEARMLSAFRLTWDLD